LPRLVIVSNRVAVPDRTGKQVAGGLAVALREAFKGHQGLWFGWSGKVAAQATSRPPRMVEGGALQYALMDLTPLDRREYYKRLRQPCTLANNALPGWPLRFLASRVCRLPTGQPHIRQSPCSAHSKIIILSPCRRAQSSRPDQPHRVFPPYPLARSRGACDAAGE